MVFISVIKFDVLEITLDFDKFSTQVPWSGKFFFSTKQIKKQ